MIITKTYKVESVDNNMLNWLLKDNEYIDIDFHVTETDTEIIWKPVMFKVK